MELGSPDQVDYSIIFAAVKHHQLRKYLLPFATLVVLAGALRFFSFFPSVINHDESTYILIGQQLLQGDTYLIDVIDTKPVGIFILYAIFQKLVGSSIFLLRLLTTIWIGITAFGLFLLGSKATNHRRVGWAAGITYVLLTSIWVFYGISPNTELFLVGFTVYAIWLVWEENQDWRYLLAGALLGIAFMIKYVALFDGIALATFLILLVFVRELSWNAALRRIGLLVSGGALPFFMVLTYYYLQSGGLDTFLSHTFAVSRDYAEDHPWWKSVVYILDFPLRFLPIFLLALLAYLIPIGQDKRFRMFLVIWYLSDLFIVVWPEKFFGHYTIQLMPAMALAASLFFHPLRTYPSWLPRLSMPGRFAGFAVILLSLKLINWNEYHKRPDHAKEVANHLKNMVDEEDQIYTGNTQQILYFLLGKKSPTPYVHRSLLWDSRLREVMNIDLESETNKILGANPKYILLSEDPPRNYLLDQILDNYELIHHFDHGDRLFQKFNSGHTAR